MSADNTVIPFPSARERPERTDTPIVETPREALGNVLRQERQDQGRTLADVADDASVSLPYLSEVERGRKDVSSELLTVIADALELPLPDVFERTADRLRGGHQRADGARFQLLAA